MTSAQRTKAPQLTHFLCLPLVTPASRPQLSTSIASFGGDVVRPTQLGGFGLPADALRPVGTLHLTLGMMSFPQNEGLAGAVAVLKALEKTRDIFLAGAAMGEQVKEKRGDEQQEQEQEQEQEAVASKILVTLRGLKSMNKPEKTTVLYAPPSSDPAGSLQRFAEKVRAIFQDAGLLVPDNRPLLLHATIVNTSYVKHKHKHKGTKKWDRIVVQDAQAIMDRYEDHVWMEAVPVEKIAICRMGAKPVDDNGAVVDAAYKVEAEVDV